MAGAVLGMMPIAMEMAKDSHDGPLELHESKDKVRQAHKQCEMLEKEGVSLELYRTLTRKTERLADVYEQAKKGKHDYELNLQALKSKKKPPCLGRSPLYWALGAYTKQLDALQHEVTRELDTVIGIVNLNRGAPTGVVHPSVGQNMQYYSSDKKQWWPCTVTSVDAASVHVQVENVERILAKETLPTRLKICTEAQEKAAEETKAAKAEAAQAAKDEAEKAFAEANAVGYALCREIVEKSVSSSEKHVE